MNFADLTEETTTATSTATISLLGASSVLMRAFAAAFSVGTTEIPVRVYDTLGNFEIGLYTLTSAALLTRTSILESSNNDLAVTFPAGTKKVACVLPASVIADFGRMSQGVSASGLPVATSMTGSDYLVLLQGGVEKTILASIVKTFMAAAVVASTGATLAGPAGGVVSVQSTDFTLSPAPAGSAFASATTYTPSDGGAGGTFAPTSITFTGAASPATFKYTPSATAGARTISFTNNGGLTNPVNHTYTSTSAAVAATGVTMTGPTGGTVSVASTNFAVGVTPVGGTISGTVTVTPSDAGGGGTFTPTSVALTTASPTATFTYTPSATAGARTISATNNGGLTNPANLTYTSTAVANSHTITPFTAGNTFQTTLSRSLAANSFTNQKQFASGVALVTDATYWNITPTSAIGAKCGWGLSNATPPADLTTVGQNQQGDTSINGMRTMSKPSSHVDECLFWVPAGADSGPWYFWIKPIDGNAQVMNPSGLMVVT